MRKLIIALLAVLAAAPAALAQEHAHYTQAELDQMLAPIALYPDALLSQVLMAATYPLEVVEAARWMRARPGLKGDEAVRAAANEDWDASVKSLLAFPDLLLRMDEQLEWTKQLGDAFLGQEPHVMETIQQLRRRAQTAGLLAADGRQRVLDDGQSIVIEPANSQVVYVPYYDPLTVYGGWWWPAYPPVAWAPWPGYAVYRPGIWWGVGVGITKGFFFGAVNWSTHRVTVARTNVYYARPPVVRGTVVVRRPLVVGGWRHDPVHRRGIVYRTPEVQRRYVRPTPERAAPPPERRYVRPTPERAAPPPERRYERRDERGPERREERSPERRDERRDNPREDRRGYVMPPAFRASAPVAAHEPARRQAAPRPERGERPRFAAPPAGEVHPRSRDVPRGGEGAWRPQGSGWQRHAERNRPRS